EMVDDLASGHIELKPQNLDERTFFPRFKRPPNGSVLSWESNADQIDRLARSLDFGIYPNPMGLPRLTVGQEFVLVRSLEVTDTTSSAPAGTITNITSDGISVSTATLDIVLRKVQSVDGLTFSLREFAERYGLHPGGRFEKLDCALLERLAAVNN